MSIFLRPWGQVGIGPLLVFDALLHVLIVEVELADAVVGAVAGVVVGDDGLEGFFLLLGVVLRCPLFPAAGLPESAARRGCPRRAERRRKRCSAGRKSGSALLFVLHAILNRR